MGGGGGVRSQEMKKVLRVQHALCNLFQSHATAVCFTQNTEYGRSKEKTEIRDT